MTIRTFTAVSWFVLLAAAAPAFAGHPVPPVTFAQERSTLAADPDELYGRLPNGMTYVIQKNATPAGTASVLLRVRAGSMMENETQKGLAHFVEHMAFEGTKHIGHGELKPMLERNGFAFGADANAFTTAQSTTYMLNAPKSDDKSLEQALFILREVAGNMTIDPATVESERGVILAEERLRDNPVQRRDTAFGKFLYPGQRMADYSNPIGSTDIIKTAPAAELKRFYHAWYRPEQTTLVIVGDFDPKAMEKQIKAKFGDWKAAAPAPDEPDWGTYHAKGPRAFSYTDTGLNREIAATWVRPLETRPDSLQRATESMQDGLLQMVFNRRYQLMLQSGEAQFLSASIFTYDNFKTSRNTVLNITPKPGKTREAFAQAWSVFHTFQDQGVTAEEAALIQSILPPVRANLEKSHATRDNGGIANTIMQAIDNDSVDLSLADALKMMDQMTPALTREGLNARVKIVFGGDGPVFTDYGADTIADFPADAVLADYAQLNGAKTTAYATQTQKPWPYNDFGKPVAPLTNTVDPDFGSEHYVFPNGVVLNVKSDSLQANQVLVQINFAGGTGRFDIHTPRPMALAFGNFFTAGGLGKLDINDIQLSLAGKVAAVNYSMSTARTTLGGATTPGDLQTQMKVLMAYTIDPGLREAAYSQFQAFVPEYLKTIRANPGGVLGYEMHNVLHPDDWRYDTEMVAKAPSVQWANVAAVYRDSLKDTPITITISGDVDVTKAVEAVAATFATLPPRPATAPHAPGSEATNFPPVKHEFVFTHDGRLDQNISLALWPTTDFYSDSRRARGFIVLAGVLQNRLYDQLREAEGADYSPQAFSFSDNDIPGYGYLQVSATIKASDDGLFRDTLKKIVADLQGKPPTPDEINRVTAPMLQGIENAKKTNHYWFDAINTAAVYPAGRRWVLGYADDIRSIDGATLLSLAKTWLKDETEIHVTVRPAKLVSETPVTAATSTTTKVGT